MPALILAILWLHYFWCLVPSWRFGEYYNYGFLVPVIAFGFAWRRAGLVREQMAAQARPVDRAGNVWLLGLALLGLLFLIPLRMVEIGDPTWRPPLILHGILLTMASHWIVSRNWSWKVSAFFLPVTVFAWSAVPYFWQLEQLMVRQLTGWVIGLTQEIFLLAGHPVERMGERLTMGGNVCEVTDGCSGIRSIQSLVMAALFFGELLWLKWPGRVALVVTGLTAAVLCNAGRAWYLASVHFSKGIEAAHAAHDTAGHVAFAVAALILFVIARLLVPQPKSRVVVSRAG